jgi:hypothetical protein
VQQILNNGVGRNRLCPASLKAKYITTTRLGVYDFLFASGLATSRACSMKAARPG